MTDMPANGTTGVLIRVLGQTMFRVYSDDRKTFVDYDLLHSDLQVTINDDDAHFYQKGGRNYLDHSPHTITEIMNDYKRGQKVIYIPENKVYDFGYVGGTGKAIIYEEGEQNMQDSYAVELEELKPA
jgi:hypothetical protein